MSLFDSPGRYFDEISQDTGKYCFGVDDTLKAMEMGAVDILIVWENLDIQRFVLKNHTNDGMTFFLLLFSFVSVEKCGLRVVNAVSQQWQVVWQEISLLEF